MKQYTEEEVRRIVGAPPSLLQASNPGECYINGEWVKGIKKIEFEFHTVESLLDSITLPSWMHTIRPKSI